MRLISREDALVAIDAKCKRYFESIGITDYDYYKADEQSRWFADGAAKAAEAVLALPTIDPVKHGRWVMQGTAYGCSLCGEGVIHPFHNYCPNCGARMREEGEEE